MLKQNRRLWTVMLAAAFMLSISPIGAASTHHADEGLVLNALILSDPAQAACIQMVADDFAERTGATVKITDVNDPDTLYQTAMTAFVGGTGEYDIISIPHRWLGDFAYPDYLISLNDYVHNDPPEVFNDILPESLALYTIWDDQLMAFPFSTEAMLLFYNAERLEENGAQPPTSWDEFDELARTLTNAEEDQYGTAVMGRTEYAVSLWANRYWGLGGDPFEMDENHPIKLDRTLAIDALQRLQVHIRDASPPDALDFGPDEAIEAFVSGQVAMIETWPTAYRAARADILFEVGVTQVPGGIPQSRGWGLGISSDSRDADIAYAFIRDITSSYFDTECYYEGGKNPIRRSTYEELADAADAALWIDAQIEALSNANPRAPTSQVDAIFGAAIADFLAGESSAEETVDALQERLDTIYD